MYLQLTAQPGSRLGIGINGPHITRAVWAVIRAMLATVAWGAHFTAIHNEAGPYFGANTDDGVDAVPGSIQFTYPKTCHRFHSTLNYILSFFSDEGILGGVDVVVPDHKRELFIDIIKTIPYTVDKRHPNAVDVYRATPANSTALIYLLQALGEHEFDLYRPSVITSSTEEQSIKGLAKVLSGWCEIPHWHINENTVEFMPTTYTKLHEIAEKLRNVDMPVTPCALTRALKIH